MATKENIIDMYMRSVGETEVPKVYHDWCCITLIAAAVGNRVGFHKYKHVRIKPNMYTLLIGDSGIGKGLAMKYAAQFVAPPFNLFNGTATRQSVIDMLKIEDDNFDPEIGNMMVMTEELANQAGTDKTTRAFIKAMTDWYTASGVQYEATRQHGKLRYYEPTINWIAGSTIEWISDVIDEKAFRSGFFARTVPVVAYEQPRKYTPWYPDDRAELLAKLTDRFEDLTTVRGTFQMDGPAQELDEEWYMSRPETPDPLVKPFQQREHVLALKLAMILSLAENHSLIIKSRHLKQAHERVGRIRRALPEVVNTATATERKRRENKVRHILKRSGKISRVDLQRKLSPMGIDKQIMDPILDNLKDMGAVEERMYAGSDTRWYIWKEGRTFYVGNLR